MANNSNRKAIEFMVQGALPPHSTNVLWMDTSVPTLPVLKIFENGAWTACHTDSSKEIEMLVQAVASLTETNNSQSKVIVDLTDEIKNLSDWEGREQERDEAISDFRTTLMGNKGEVRVRPLVAAKIVENGTEHCGFIAQAPNEDKQVFYDGITPDTGIFFFAAKSEGLLNAYEGQTSGFPLGIKSGVEAFYPIGDWHVCTEAPQDITSAASTWQTEVIQAGEVWRCKEEHKYYNSSDEYIGSIYVYEKVGQGEVTLDDIKEISKDILYSVENIDTSALAKQGTNPNATLSEVQAQATSAASDAAAAKTAIGTPASGQPSTLFAAIAACGGGGDAQESTSQEILAAVRDILPSQEDIAASYSILREKGVPIPMPSEQTYANLPSTIAQINDPYAGYAYLSALTIPNSTDYQYINMSGIVWIGSGFQALQNHTYIQDFRGLHVTNSFTSLDSICFGVVADTIDISSIDASHVTNANRLFFNATIRKIDMHGLDLRLCTTLNQHFYGLKNCEWIDMSGTKVSTTLTTIGDISAGTSASIQTLVGDLTIDEVVNGNICILEGIDIAQPNALYGVMTSLNRASLRAIINGLADRTGLSTLTCYLGATNIAKLSAEDIAVATNKNWTLA